SQGGRRGLVEEMVAAGGESPDAGDRGLCGRPRASFPGQRLDGSQRMASPQGLPRQVRLLRGLGGSHRFGDAEHFRPKGKVTILVDEKTVTVQVAGKDHPGYYWLVYDWRNLFPACSQCNTGGKMNHFPVARTHVTAHDADRNDPDDLDAIEEPLLLNPYKDQPHEYLLFGDHGILTAVDGKLKGQNSIEIYRLKRGPLV